MENELPEGFMNHLQVLPGDVPKGAVIPVLPPGYPLIFVERVTDSGI
jgi:hypothetical protein